MGVQVFDPTPRPSEAGMLGQALGMGLSKVGENIGMQQKQSQLAKLLFGEEGEQYAGLPAEQQLKVAEQQLKASELQLKEQEGLEKQRVQQQKTSLLESILGDTQPDQGLQTEPSVVEGVPSTPAPATGGRKKFSQKDLIALSMVDPQTARLIQAEQEQQEKHEQKLKSETRKETLPFKQKVIEEANAAREAIQNKEKLLRLIDTENLTDPTVASLLTSLPFKLGERFLSPETVEYRAGLIDEYRDLKLIFTGQTRTAELDILEKKIAGIYLTDTQKKAIIKSRMEALNAPLAKEEAAIEVESTMPGLSMFEWNKEVNNLAKQKTQAIFHKFLDEQNFIIGQAEKRKTTGVPLDKNNAEDREIAEQIYREAGGDYKKAEILAEKRGYKFK